MLLTFERQLTTPSFDVYIVYKLQLTAELKAKLLFSATIATGIGDKYSLIPDFAPREFLLVQSIDDVNAAVQTQFKRLTNIGLFSDAGITNNEYLISFRDAIVRECVKCFFDLYEFKHEENGGNVTFRF